MSKTLPSSQVLPPSPPSPPIRLVVVWIDWYAYHVARFEGLLSDPELAGRVRGVELVGGIGVHAGLKFREELPAGLPVDTLLPAASWHDADKVGLSRLLWQTLTRLDPAAVLVPGYYTLPGLVAALWARAHGRESILMTESTAFDHRRSRLREAAKSLLLRALFDSAVAGGEAHRRYLRLLGFPMDRVAGRYDVVNNRRLAAWAAADQSLGAHAFGLPPTPFFLFVGRLAPEKNVEGLLSAWMAYRESGGSWPLVLVGDGPSAETVRAQASASAFPADVHFLGLRGTREIASIYAFAGCFVLPSTREPWGLVVNEAMACALPVLVSSCCGCAEDLVRDGVNGYIFNPAAVAELTQGLRTMASASLTERKMMGDASARIIASYSPQRFGQEIASLLSSESRKMLSFANAPAHEGNFSN